MNPKNQKKETEKKNILVTNSSNHIDNNSNLDENIIWTLHENVEGDEIK